MQVGDEDALGAEEHRLQHVADAERPAAQDDDRLAAAHHLVEPVRDGHRLGQHRHLVGHLVRHAKQRRAGEEVHPLGPAAPEARRPRQRQRVAVVLEPLAHEVRLAAPAPPAAPARDVRRRHDPRAELEHVAELVDEPRAVAELGEHADVLVPADQRIVDRVLVRRARVLQALAAKRVLVGAADAA